MRVVMRKIIWKIFLWAYPDAYAVYFDDGTTLRRDNNWRLPTNWSEILRPKDVAIDKEGRYIE